MDDSLSWHTLTSTFLHLQIIQHIAKKLEALHAIGYVHRDLKPANIIFLPRENRWTIIDFGSAGQTGKQAPLSFTLPYAAPEVVAAVRSGQDTMLVHEALDAWSLGVVSYELLSGKRAIPPYTEREEVRMLQLQAAFCCATFTMQAWHACECSEFRHRHTHVDRFEPLSGTT
jgi:serine/threonine protein kinase